MTEKLDLIIENGSIVSTSSIEKIDIGIRNGRIALLGNLRNRDARKRFNAKNLFILDLNKKTLILKKDIIPGKRITNIVSSTINF